MTRGCVNVLLQNRQQRGCHACDDSRLNADDIYSTVLMFYNK